MISSENLVVVTNVASPYRLEVFERAAAAFDRLTVVFQLDSEADRTWEVRPKTSFESVYLGGRVIRAGSRSVTICRGVGGILRARRPAAIVACGYSITTAQIAILANRMRIPLVLMNDGIATTDCDQGPELLYRKLITKSATGYIASCRLAREYLERLGAPRDRVRVVELTTDLRAIAQTTSSADTRARARWRWRLEGPTVAFVGRLVPNKRVGDLLKAFTMVRDKIPGAQLVIAGDGPLRQELEGSAGAGAASGVQFTGMLGWVELVELYAGIDALAFPVVRERFGMVVIEALAAGVPVVASSGAGATPDLIEDGQNGYVVEPYDVQGLCGRLTAILGNPELRTRMSASARRIVEKHDVRIEVKRFVEAVKAAIARGHSVGRPLGRRAPASVG